MYFVRSTVLDCGTQFPPAVAAYCCLDVSGGTIHPGTVAVDARLSRIVAALGEDATYERRRLALAGLLLVIARGAPLGALAFCAETDVEALRAAMAAR